MYCTGGIRCEKASAYVRSRGVEDVSQLAGGIHRYLEEFEDGGHFKGKNFVFDQRVAVGPAGAAVVGRCLGCAAPYDELSGGRVCTVCRVLVLVCPGCAAALQQYHCEAHQPWRRCYFSYLGGFSAAELKAQAAELQQHWEDLGQAPTELPLRAAAPRFPPAPAGGPEPEPEPEPAAEGTGQSKSARKKAAKLKRIAAAKCDRAATFEAEAAGRRRCARAGVG
jgi:hypothetical protein